MKFTSVTVAIFLATTASACDMKHQHSESRQLGSRFELVPGQENNVWESVEAFRKDPHARCGTRDPSQEEKDLLNQVVQDWQTFNRRNRRLKAKHGNNGKKEKSQTSPIVINTVVHIIRDSSRNGPTTQMVKDQIDVINAAFAPHFVYNVIKTTDTVNDAWFASDYGTEGEKAMKSLLRVGGPETLNVYFTEPRGLGWATSPAAYELAPAMDGVVIQYLSMPGGTTTNYNEGDTLVHEIGHWLGLIHTFNGGCKGNGDFNRDTSAEAEPSFGCPVGQDTCRGQGKDPIYNYMDYSDDSCMNSFTAGQIDRMLAHYKAFRDPDPKSGRFISCARNVIRKVRCKNYLQCCGGTCNFCDEP